MRPLTRPAFAPQLPDPWRASRVAFIIAGVAGAFLTGLVAVSAGIGAGVAAGAFFAALSVVAELQAAWRLRGSVAAFASALPTEGREPFERWTSEQGIRWPALGVTITGRVASYRVPPLIVEVGSGSFTVAHRRARRAGEDLAARLGLAPAQP